MESGIKKDEGRSVADILRPGVIVVLVGSILWLLINPPSFSGIPDLAIAILGAVAFALLTAFIVTRLTKGEMDEKNWQRLVERSELLAQLPPPSAPPSFFDQLVLEAIENLPDQFRDILDKVPVSISDEGARYGAYGLYVGASIARDVYPDHIVIFKDTLVRDFGSDYNRLRLEVERVLRHELAHHLGWDEAGVRGLGL